jgi:N-acetylglucosaminyldiphosphoundecaprenol N-acetyl-beta-D-mannosaminyltransferase
MQLFPSPKTYDVLGVPVSEVDLDAATSLILQWSNDRRGRVVCIRDVHGVMRAQEDDHLMQIHREAALVTPDGMPIVVLGKLQGRNVSRVCGPDLLPQVIDKGRATGLSHYFFGGGEGIAKDLVEAMRGRFPGVNIVGWETPPFRPLSEQENSSILERIQQSGADVVWVGLGTPKQEYWMHRMAALSSATFIGVGAAFDFHTGKVSRAPKWMQAAMLEWLYRFAAEPRRLWRRYLVLAPKFAFQVVAQGITRRFS